MLRNHEALDSPFPDQQLCCHARFWNRGWLMLGRWRRSNPRKNHCMNRIPLVALVGCESMHLWTKAILIRAHIKAGLVLCTFFMLHLLNSLFFSQQFLLLEPGALLGSAWLCLAAKGWSSSPSSEREKQLAQGMEKKTHTSLIQGQHTISHCESHESWPTTMIEHRATGRFIYALNTHWIGIWHCSCRGHNSHDWSLSNVLRENQLKHAINKYSMFLLDPTIYLCKYTHLNWCATAMDDTMQHNSNSILSKKYK